MTRALLVDGFELFRLTLRDILRRTGQFETIEEAADSGSFLRLAADDRDAALAVLHPRSIGMQEDDCLSCARRLLPDADILIFADSSIRQAQAADAGRLTRLPRAASAEDVKLAIERFALSRQDAASDRNGQMQARLATSRPAIRDKLSQRQRQIMDMVAEGLANKEIAHRLGIAEGTVKAHIHAVFRALGVSNRTQAVLRYGVAAPRALQSA